MTSLKMERNFLFLWRIRADADSQVHSKQSKLAAMRIYPMDSM